MESESVKNRVSVIYRKELSTYQNTGIGYVFGSFFLLITSFLFFFGLGESSFWDRNVASMEGYFNWMPILFILFIPALTMRLWSEEERSGTLETLLTLPFSLWEIVLGKFLSAWSFLCLLLLASLPIPISIWLLGGIDWGVTFSGYLGTVLLGGSYISVGMVVSALTKDQISCYILSLLLCLLFFLMGYQPVLQFFPTAIGTVLAFFSVAHHFDSFRLGLLEWKEFYFFLSFGFLFLLWNVQILRSKR